MGQSQGAQSQLAMDPTAIGAGSEYYHFLRETLTDVHDLIDDGDNAIRGTRSHPQERVNQGLIDISGSIWMNPTPDELDNLLPRILGGSENLDVFPVAETVPSFVVAIDRVARVHTYSGCKVNRAIFSGRKGQPVTLELQIIGASVSEGAAGSFPSLTPSSQTPYVFHEGVLTLQASSRSFDQFVLIVDNRLEREYNNSRTATDIVARDRAVFLATSTPYTATETDLLTTPVGSAAGAAATLVFTKGGQSTTFTLANIKSFARSPNVPGKRQIRLPLQYKAYKTTSANEIEITHDPVP